MEKVFYSDIIRNKTCQINDLKDLYKVTPAQPSLKRNEVYNDCDFQPKNDKYYVPKKKSKLKVRTIRDIRNTFEKDVLVDLPYHLERQQNVLLRKIRDGSSKNNQTKLLAKNILNSEDPITRSSWQMLMNINPENHLHSFQYVLFEGEPVRINGSKGGGKRFIYNFDLGKIKKNSWQNKIKPILKKKYLLRNSLSVNFKPGPLSRKKQLDKSYQKYNVGELELMTLPKPVLEIQSAHGSTLDSTITNLIHNFRDVNGFISEKWAEFAVSVLGANCSASVEYQSNNSSVTFDLRYKCDQRKILMRRDQYGECQRPKTMSTMDHKDIFTADETDVTPEVRDIMSDILDAVEISLNQDNMYTGEDEPREQCREDLLKGTSYPKDRNKKKYCELGRLDVTVIRIPENDINTKQSVCCKTYCKLGCICNSLQCTIPLKSHCGRIGCMFECKCNLSKYKLSADYDDECRELLPGLINLKEEMNNKLAKEEQKFHQTVIVTGNQSILLKSKRRNMKSSKKYEDFCCDINSKPESKMNPILSIFITKLNCDNMEPWCMVHNLYKCFCKCKFTNTVSAEKAFIEPEKREVILDEDLSYFETSLHNDQEEQIKNRLHDVKQTRTTNNSVIVLDDKSTRTSKSDEPVRYRTRYGRTTCILQDEYNDIDSFVCARTKPFINRKYTSGYYVNANKKIHDMEVNDAYLKKRLQYLVDESIEDATDLKCTTPEKENTRRRQRKERHQEKSIENEKEEIIPNPEAISDTSSENKSFNTDMDPPNLEMIEASSDKRISKKPKLVAWLEASYKQYKKRMDMGNLKCTLEPPKKQKVCLYPWDFILSRYSERKNLFLVSKNQPFRIFMAVDSKNPLFQQCINIDEIRFADLNKYPVTVKNLLTNTSGLKDNFCILYGLTHCWELIGAVMKINDKKKKSNEDNRTHTPELEFSNLSSLNKERFEEPALEQTVSDTSIASISANDSLELSSPDKSSTSESSKWFVMTVEDDFSEIQFYNKGFFVKHESIIKAINVARMTGKTVRLSSQKCSEKSNNPQFGIYAIPNANDYCVFVGPYENDDSLGIETVNIVSNVRKNRTRGVWINTNKVDNLKVIDNPLSFMPSEDVQMNEMLPLENLSMASYDKPLLLYPQPDHSPEKCVSQADRKNAVKPIKLKKIAGSFRIAPKSLLKKINTISQVESMSTEGIIISKPSPSIMNSPLIPLLTKPLQRPKIITPLLKTTCPPSTDDGSVIVLDSNIHNIPIVCERKKPVAEVAPQIKIAAVYSEAINTQPEKRPDRMIVLKPEEINKRILDNDRPTSQPLLPEPVSNDIMDVEDFLDSSMICAAPADNTLLISDDENESSPRKVWIKCKNIELGFIEGEMNKEGEISFKFPGFKCSNFYKEAEAFGKIHQVLSRKVYVPTNLDLQWEVVNSIDNIENFHVLEKEALHSKNVLTENGLQPISLFYKSCSSSNFKTCCRKKADLQDSASTSTENPKKLCLEVEISSAALESTIDNPLLDGLTLTNELQEIMNENEELSPSREPEEISEEQEQPNRNDN